MPDIFAPAFCNDGRSEIMMALELSGPSSGTKFFETVDSYCGMDMLSAPKYVPLINTFNHAMI